MATVVLQCGPVAASGSLASVVGGGSQWADGSDATYGQFGTFAPTSTPGDILQAPLNTPVAGVTSAELVLRCDNTDPSGSLIRASVAGPGWTAPEVKSSGAFGGTFTVPTGITEVRNLLTGLVGTSSPAAVFDQPAALFITWASVASGSRLRILEASVIVTTSDEVVTYRRIYPRDDRRNWPPPKAYSRGNRRGGGYL